MKTGRTLVFLLLAWLFSVWLLIGCGGRAPSPSARRATLRLTVRWPERTRLIPRAANSLRVTLRREGSELDSRLLTRPEDGTTTSARFTDLADGQVDVAAEAFSAPDGSGPALARAAGSAPVRGGEETRLSLSLVSTVARLDVRPPLAVGVGRAAELPYSAYDAEGNLLVLAPEAVSVSSDNAGVLTVEADGALRGVAPGSAAVTVRDTESGVSATTAPLAVRPLQWIGCFLAASGHPDGDTLRQFQVQSDGRLQPFSPVSIPGGRYGIDLQAHPRLPFAYLVNQGHSTGEGSVMVYRITETGLQPLHVYPYDGEGTAFPGSIRFSPNGRFAYVSNHHDILQYRVGSDGSLTPLNPSKVNINPGWNLGSSYLKISPDGQRLYNLFNDKATRVFRFGEDGQLVQLQMTLTFNMLSLSRVHPQGRALYSVEGVNRGIITYLLDGVGLLTTNPPETAPGASLSALEFSRDGQYAWTAFHSVAYPSVTTPARVYRVAADGTLTTFSAAIPGSSQAFDDLRLHPTENLLYAHPYWSGSTQEQNRWGMYRINANGTLTALGAATPSGAGNVGPFFLPVVPSSP